LGCLASFKPVDNCTSICQDVIDSIKMSEENWGPQQQTTIEVHIKRSREKIGRLPICHPVMACGQRININ